MDFTTTPFTYKTKQGTKEQHNLPQGEEIQFGLNITEWSLGRWSRRLWVGGGGVLLETMQTSPPEPSTLFRQN